MTPLRFHLRAWSGLYDGVFCGSRVADTSNTPAKLPALLRRRVSELGREALQAAWCLDTTPMSPGHARLILSSRHGEYARTLSLIHAAIGNEGLSPADFTLAVHNALLGLLSIAELNHCGHSAVAAGRESFCFGLLEAAACLSENPKEPVLLIHFDERLPAPFDVFNDEKDSKTFLILSLTSGTNDTVHTTDEGEFFEFYFSPKNSPCPKYTVQSHVKDFMDFIRNDSWAGTSLSDTRQWAWSRLRTQ